MTPTRRRLRFRPVPAAIASVCACAVLVGTVSAVQSQPATFTTTHVRTTPVPEPAGLFKYKWNGRAAWLARRGAAVAAPENEAHPGTFHWKKPSNVFSAGNMDEQFDSYSAEVPLRVVEGADHTFAVQTYPFPPDAFGLDDDNDGPNRKEADRRSAYVREHFGRNYFRHESGKTDPDTARRAFQVALWKIVHETAPPDGVRDARHSLFVGEFQADYPPAARPEFVAVAQGYLDRLRCAPTMFEENPRLREWELVRLKGLPSAKTNGVPQSQFALRHVQAQGRSAGDDSPDLLGAKGDEPLGPGFGGLGGGGNGSGNGLGGGPRGLAGGGSNSSVPGGANPLGGTTGSGFSPAAVPLGATVGDPAPKSPPTGPSNPRLGTVGPPDPPTPAPGEQRSPEPPVIDPAAVPGPAGAVLGGIAFLMLLARRGLRRPRAARA